MAILLNLVKHVIIELFAQSYNGTFVLIQSALSVSLFYSYKRLSLKCTYRTKYLPHRLAFHLFHFCGFQYYCLVEMAPAIAMEYQIEGSFSYLA